MNMKGDTRSETTPLIRRALPTAGAVLTAQPNRHQLSAYTVLSFLCAVRFVAGITNIPKIGAIRQVACRWWLAKYDPEALPSEGLFPPECLCDNKSVGKEFSLVIRALTVIDAFGVLASAGLIRHYALRYGRKRVMLSLMVLVAASTVCFVAAVGVHATSLQVGLLLACVVLGALCSPMAFLLVGNMYVVDMTEPHETTFMLNKAEGFAMLGNAPTFWVGDYLSRQFGVVTVFYLKLVLIIPLIVYVLAFLPESFPSKKRAATLPQESSCTRTPRTSASVLRRTINVIASVFAPLKLLRPSRDAISGKSDSRLLIIALAQFLNTLGSSYVGNAFVAYTEVKFDIGSNNLAFALSGYAVLEVVWLWIVVPKILLSRLLPAFYDWCRRSRSHDDLEAQPANSRVARPGHRFDIYFAVASAIVGSLVSIFLGLASSLEAIIAAFIMLSLGTGHNPTVRSITVTSVDSLHNDDALSALTIVNEMGSCLSPLVYGSVLSSTIAQSPELVFFLCAVPIFIGGILLLFTQAREKK